jgi:hypothetical protein
LKLLSGFPFSQVLKDMRSAIQAALEERDQAKVEAEKEEWRRRASQAWTDIAKDSATGPDVELSKKKSYRGKALEWCVAVDHMLWSASGQRLSFFCQKGALAERPPPQAWPILTLAIDQGSDGWCAAYYLMMAKQCGLLLCKDTSHRIWNDTWLAIEHSELKLIFLLLIVVLNSDHGPWKDARWLQTAREGAQAYAAVGGPDDPLFQRHVHQIIEEMGLQHRSDEGDALYQEVWESIPECVQHMTTKVATSRWFGVFDSLERFLPIWSRRLLLLQYIGMELGLWSADPLKDVVAKVTVPKAASDRDVAKAPTSAESVDVAAIRKACNNTLHLCCLVLGDRDIQQLCIGVCLLVRPIRAEFQWQHKKMRSTPEVADTFLAYSRGRGRQSLEDVVVSFCSGTVLEEVGLHNPGNWPPELAELDGGHPIVLADNLLVSRFATFVLQILKNRLRSTSWSEFGYPGKFAACLGSGEEAAKVMATMEKDWALWNKVVGIDRAAWRKAKERSSFHLVVVQKATH